jgi:hypothetical protein
MTEQQYEYIVVGKDLMGEQGDAGERSSHAADADYPQYSLSRRRDAPRRGPPSSDAASNSLVLPHSSLPRGAPRAGRGALWWA